MEPTEYLKYYHREEYLFKDVSDRFQVDGCLAAFDFFCIVIWKANRAKSKIAKRILEKGFVDLDTAVGALTRSIYEAQDAKARLRILIEDWGFRLPMASAILTVFYPKEFTIYDVRVCEILHGFDDVQNKKPFEKLWKGYEEFILAVKAAANQDADLRSKDRWLWGKSFALQLTRDIENNFSKK